MIHLCVNEDVFGGDQPCLHKRVEGELGAGGVAAWVGKQPCPLDLISGNLRETIHSFLL